MKHAKQMATCAMMTAVCVVLMLLGGILEIGIYAAPMFAGLCLVPIGERWGRRTQLMVYLAVALLSFLLVPSLEENLIFAALLGWYPILRPSLQKLPRLLRLSVKLLLFNAVIIAVEALLLTLITPEPVGGWMLVLLLVLGNFAFLAYDFLLPAAGLILRRLGLKL